MTDIIEQYLGTKKKPIITAARIWKRLLAFAIDYLILNTLILFPFSNIIEKIYGKQPFDAMVRLITERTIDIMPLIYVTISVSAITLAYFVLLEMLYRQSIGKMAMGIYVSEATGGRQNARSMQSGALPALGCIIRSIPVALAYSVPVILLFDAGYAYFSENGQRLFERLSKTWTVEQGYI